MATPTIRIYDAAGNGGVASVGQLLVDGDLIETDIPPSPMTFLGLDASTGPPGLPIIGAIDAPGGIAALEGTPLKPNLRRYWEAGEGSNEAALGVLAARTLDSNAYPNWSSTIPIRPQWLWKYSQSQLELGQYAFVNNPDADYNSIGLLADPHVICADGTRIDIYAPGFYRYYDNGQVDPRSRLVVNVRVDQDARGSDYASAVWIKEGDKDPICHTFEGPIFDSLVDGSTRRVQHSMFDPSTSSKVTIVVDGHYNSIGTEFDATRPFQHLGGLVSGKIHTLASLDDCAPVPARIVRINAWTANALACGSTDPHIVTFGRARVYPGGCDDVILFEHGDVCVKASFTSSHHIRSLVLGSIKSEEKISATWDDVTGCATIDFCHKEGAKKRTLEGIEDIFETVALLGPNNLNLFVRLQAHGVASFAVSGDVSRLGSGILMRTEDDVALREPMPPTAATAAVAATTAATANIERKKPTAVGNKEKKENDTAHVIQKRQQQQQQQQRCTTAAPYLNHRRYNAPAPFLQHHYYPMFFGGNGSVRICI